MRLLLPNGLSVRDRQLAHRVERHDIASRDKWEPA